MAAWGGYLFDFNQVCLHVLAVKLKQNGIQRLLVGLCTHININY